MILSLAFAMLMQVGSDPHIYPQAPLPAITQHRKDEPPPPVDPMAQCLTRGRSDVADAVAFARSWLAEAKTPAARARPDECLGLMLSDQGDFAGAEAAFADAVSVLPAPQSAGAVPLMAMAGNAALANGDAGAALGWFDRALAIKDYDDAAARGAILADRARALVASGRTAEAAQALTEAREAAPADAGVFLLSATLARRGNDLAAAQGFIETAAALDPRDPATGLEAGVIAVLAGHDAAARKSWNSVLAMAPDSAEAATARGYLAQLAPDAAQPLDRPATAPTLPAQQN